MECMLMLHLYLVWQIFNLNILAAAIKALNLYTAGLHMSP